MRRRQAVGSNALYMYTWTNAHRSTWKWRQSASEILHPTWGQVAEVGGVCGGRPSSAGLAEDPQAFSVEEHSSKEIDPWKGARADAATLPFSSGISEVPSCLPGLSGRLQRTGDRDVGSQFRCSLRCNHTRLSAQLWDEETDGSEGVLAFPWHTVSTRLRTKITSPQHGPVSCHGVTQLLRMELQDKAIHHDKLQMRKEKPLPPLPQEMQSKTRHL